MRRAWGGYASSSLSTKIRNNEEFGLRIWASWRKTVTLITILKIVRLCQMRACIFSRNTTACGKTLWIFGIGKTRIWCRIKMEDCPVCKHLLRHRSLGRKLMGINCMWHKQVLVNRDWFRVKALRKQMKTGSSRNLKKNTHFLGKTWYNLKFLELSWTFCYHRVFTLRLATNSAEIFFIPSETIGRISIGKRF